MHVARANHLDPDQAVGGHRSVDRNQCAFVTAMLHFGLNPEAGRRMKTIRRILVVVDADMQATAALHRAVELARLADVELHLLMCVYEPLIDFRLGSTSTFVQDLARAQYLEQRRNWLNRQTADITAKGIRAECEVLWAPATHEAVLARVLDLRPGLVIKDLRPRRRPSWRTLATSFDRRLARTCPAPLMFVHQDSPILPRHLAAAIDVSSDAVEQSKLLNDAIAEIALQLAMFVNADLQLLYAFPYHRPSNAVSVSAYLRDLYDDARMRSSANFRHFAERHSVPEDHRVWLGARGDVGSTILHQARAREVDLLVIGSTYHSAFDRLLLGSVSEHLLANGRCDILLLKPADFVDVLQRHYKLAALQRRYGMPDTLDIARAARA